MRSDAKKVRLGLSELRRRRNAQMAWIAEVGEELNINRVRPASLTGRAVFFEVK